MTQKRPIGLKAQKQQHSQKKLKPTKDDNDSFTTVALAPTKGDQSSSDGLTIEDLLQLKLQADELIDNPDGPDDQEQLVNLLRGICHESVRQIELIENVQDKTSRVTLHQLLGWATLELGIFFNQDEDLDRLRQADEPKSLDSWLLMTSKILNNVIPAVQPEKTACQIPDLELLPLALSLLSSQSPHEILQELEKMAAKFSTQSVVYFLRTIDRLVLLKSDIFSQDPTPIFTSLVKFLNQLRELIESNDEMKSFIPSIHQRLGDCHLSHGSLLAEQLEEKYYPEVENQETGDEDFPIDINDPTYQLCVKDLRLAEKTFLDLIQAADVVDESQDELKSKLEETLLTLGNLQPPGPERESLYRRAGLKQSDSDD
ncbi:hypothetical protein O181_032095 [Austropuccinia psidii MF-1]|uniref:Uncharacterized protein n=1 Tax=Austropuccinia psidii MF-1 TaxID=1389203 RepID=A0A9Q3D0D9_9BASI|nr:hypothetical protein [Austropuccinia psidii MF-1]